MGVERWFERKASDLRGERRKITPTGALSPWGWAPTALAFRHTAARRQRCTASSAWRQMMVESKTSLEGRRTSRLGEEGRRGAFPRVLSAGRKCFGGLRFCVLHIKQIAASRVRCRKFAISKGKIPVEKRRAESMPCAPRLHPTGPPGDG